MNLLVSFSHYPHPPMKLFIIPTTTMQYHRMAMRGMMRRVVAREVDPADAFSAEGDDEVARPALSPSLTL